MNTILLHTEGGGELLVNLEQYVVLNSSRTLDLSSGQSLYLEPEEYQKVRERILGASPGIHVS